MMARVLAPESTVLLLDESYVNLDPHWQLTVLERRREEANAGRTVILSIHDLDLARHYGDRVIVIDKGRVVRDDTPENALSADILEGVFHVARQEDRWVRV